MRTREITKNDNVYKGVTENGNVYKGVTEHDHMYKGDNWEWQCVQWR